LRLRRSSEERCERARLWVSLELDGELSEVERALLEEHVTRCPACAVVRADLDALTATIRQAPLVEPRRRFGLERPAYGMHAPRAALLRFAAAAALTAVAVGLGALVSSVGADRSAPPPPTADLAFLEPNGKREFRDIRKDRRETPRPAREAPRVGGV
jgi:hypothetical protein